MSDASKIFEDINKLQEKLENNYLKTITIMFTDLKDSTKYFEKHGDIKGRLFIERHNNMLFPIIEQHNGAIIKTIGDSIMAKFDSPYLAVRASIEMQKSLDEYNNTAIEKIRIRIGIHTGQAIVEHNDVFGDAVNVAARIESDTAPSRTTISKTTLEEIKKFTEIKTRPLGKVKFKGKSEEMETFSVLWRTTELEDNLEEHKKTIKDEEKNETSSSSKEIISLPKAKEKIKNIPKKYIIILAIVISSLLITTFVYSFFIKSSKQKSSSNYNTELSEDRKQIQEYAKSFINKEIPKSPKWSNQLSGFIKMVYLYFDIDITDTNPKKENSGWKTTTELIYSFIQENGKLSKIGTPKAGDLIFFNNTYDKNNNGKLDDLLTTVGLVIGTDNEKTVYFLYKVGRTIRVRNMNLNFPNKENIKNKNIIKVLNSKIRRLSKKDIKNNIPNLSSQLFASYGSILDIPKSDGSLTKIKDFKLYKNLGNHQREKVVKFALNFKGKKLPNNNKWRNTSSGFIKMIFLNFSLNIAKPEENKTNNGKWLNMVELIHRFNLENGRLFKDNSYQIGDLIFFDNTYDKNKNGKFDDKLTSIGIIVKKDKKGNIKFLINISGKIKLKHMNLKKQENKITINEKQKTINSVMRYFKKDKKFSYQLFNTFGSIFK